MPTSTKSANPAAVAYLWTQKKVPKLHLSSRQDYSVCEISGDICIFAGCVEGVPRNDLLLINPRYWLILNIHPFPVESFTSEALNTSGETPCPRSGHSTISIGRYLLVFGGETLNSRWDDSLYSLDIGIYTHSLLGVCQINQINFYRKQNLDEVAHAEQFLSWTERPLGGRDQIHHQVIFGGKDADRYFNDLWCYDPIANTWSQIVADGGPQIRAGHAACTHNHLMYIFGGHNESGEFLNEVYVFNFRGILERFLSLAIVENVRDYMELCSGRGSFRDAQDYGGSQDLSARTEASHPPLVYTVESYRRLSSSDLKTNQLLTPSPVRSEPNPINDTSGQNSGSVSYINRTHSPSPLQVPSNFILDNGKANTATSLDYRAPAQLLNESSNSIKSCTSAQLSNPPSNIGLPDSTSRNFVPSSTTLTENKETVTNSEESNESRIRQFATFIPLSPDKAEYSQSTELGMLRVLTSNSPSPDATSPSILHTPRKNSAGDRVAEKPTLMSPDYKSASLAQITPVPDSHVDGKARPLTGFTSSEELTTEAKFGAHAKNYFTVPNSYPEKVTSIFEEKLSTELDFDDNDEDSSETPLAALKSDPAAGFPLEPDTPKNNVEIVNYNNSKVDLWTSVEEIVSDRIEHLAKEGPTLHCLKSLQQEQSDPEKIKLLQTLLLLKDQLSKAQLKVTQNCEYAVQRIADGEKHRQVALQEAAYLRMKISAMNSSSAESLCKIEQDRIIELEKRLAKALAENQSLLSKIDLQTQEAAKDRENRLLAEESSRNNLNRAIEAESSCRVVKEKFTSLEDALKRSQQAVLEANNKASKAEATLYAKETEATVMLERLASLEESSAQERQARELASNVVNAANDRANEAERMWMDAQQEIQALEKESIELRKTIEQKSEELARSHFQASEMEALWLATKQQLESLESISQVFHSSKQHSENGAEEKLTRANYRIAELEAELNLLREVKEGSRDVIEKLESDNNTLAQKVEDLEKKHHDAQSDLSELRLRLADAQDNIYEMKLQLMNSQDLLRAESLELEGARLKITTLANMMQELSCTGSLDSHRIVALASDKLDNDIKSRQHNPEDNVKLKQQLESVQDRLNQTKLHNKELQEKYKATLQELHVIVEKQQSLFDSEKASKAKVAAAEHEIAKLKDQFLAMQVKANSLEDLLRQSRPKPTSLNNDMEICTPANQEKIQKLEKQLEESEKKSARMEKDTQRAIKYVRDSESMLRKMKAELQRSQAQVIELTKQMRAKQMI
ncbi:hypothetical protein K493DRAFT_306788 [Basidiobolus meristosporus CBS 931.73]|uniref:Galactose oxidase n=1 Tax=Basidiobolus meristosporus CBS 931.73 TaxID=1314790 RepID=A0A1Y1XQN1_9FUNG|nr:hypothetical protein K493DRAFT_306788 [Basidiobolus meristosporus CBS 931.73]|eukprot:ORX88052.1 hypothetical protein K493DRAFT_306788 [Basidiobolus meristosporus CBS 931.73]